MAVWGRHFVRKRSHVLQFPMDQYMWFIPDILGHIFIWYSTSACLSQAAGELGLLGSTT